MLNPMEAEALEVLQQVSDQFAVGRPVKKIPYRDTMGKIMRMIIKLENKQYGCSTGRHSTSCECRREHANERTIMSALQNNPR